MRSVIYDWQYVVLLALTIHCANIGLLVKRDELHCHACQMIKSNSCWVDRMAKLFTTCNA
jgi:hypothetical protein